MAVVTKQTNDDESREPSPPTELLCTLLEQPMIPAAAALTAGVTEIVAGVRVTALHSAAPSEPAAEKYLSGKQQRESSR